MAEALLNTYYGDTFEAESAGFEPGELNPLVVRVMREIDIDISGNSTDSVFDFFRQGRRYDYVITVCDESQAEKCPIFPGFTKRIQWSFEDPSLVQGTEAEKLVRVREIRDEIKARIEEWANEFNTFEAEE